MLRGASRPAPRPLLHALLLGVFSLVGAIAFSSLNGAHASEAPLASQPFERYIERQDGSAADPINLVFIGATADSAADAVHAVLGWTPVRGAPMFFRDHGVLRPAAWQLGVPSTHGARLHLRIEATASSGRRSYVLASVHRDDAVACGHVGRGFDQARRLVASAFAQAGYQVTLVQLGNTAPGPQCDGSASAGDGVVAVVHLGPQPRR